MLVVMEREEEKHASEKEFLRSLAHIRRRRRQQRFRNKETRPNIERDVSARQSREMVSTLVEEMKNKKKKKWSELPHCVCAAAAAGIMYVRKDRDLIVAWLCCSRSINNLGDFPQAVNVKFKNIVAMYSDGLVRIRSDTSYNMICDIAKHTTILF